MPFKKLQTAIIYFFLVVLAMNIFAVTKEYQKIRSHPLNLAPPGYEFGDLAPFLAGERVIGYFTDFDFSPESLANESFLSAQYQLAPIILDVDNRYPRLILIDPSTREAGLRLTEKLGMVPVYINPYGISLVQKE